MELYEIVILGFAAFAAAAVALALGLRLKDLRAIFEYLKNSRRN